MKYLSFVDYAIIISYFIILIGIGQFLKRRASASLNDYFLGNRKIPWWLLGISGMAAWVDMTGTMIISSFLFMLGPRGLYVEFRGGACLVLLFLLLWLGKWHRRSGCMTLAEWMIFRFGKGFGGNFARFIAVLSMIILTMGLLVYSFVGAGLFLSMFMPFPPWLCTLALLIVTIIYTVEAGFYGVVISDLFQMTIFIVAAIFISVMVFSKVTASHSIEAIAVSVTGNKDWMSSLPSLHTTMPKGYGMYQSLLAITGFYLAKTIIQGLGVGYEPRYFGARNDRECGLLSFMCGWTMSVRWFLMMGFVILGLFLVKDFFADQTKLTEAAVLIKQELGPIKPYDWAESISNIMNHPQKYSQSLTDGLNNLLGDEWTQKLSLLSYDGTVAYERILPAVLLFYIPIGMRGLMLVALLAAAMSTFNAFINMTTGFFTNDVYKSYLRPKASNRELIGISYVFGIVLVTISFLMYLKIKSINDIWGWITMGLAGSLIIPLALRFYWWRFNGMGFAIGTSCGLIVAIYQRAFLPDMLEWKQFVYSTFVGLVASVVATYLFPPPDKKVLENFYIKTKPFGFWKKFEHLLTPEQLKRTKREHFYDIIAVPFTFLWQVTILLIPMQLLIGAYRSCLITGIICAIGLLGMYFFWYKKLPAANFDSTEDNVPFNPE